jgi:electron transfer flavoprotein beta subunit
MKIVVLVKHVPDAAAERSFAADHTTDRAAADGRLSELDEYAVEEALRITEAQGGEVTVVTMGPPEADAALKKTLQMGADSAIHIVDDALHGTDSIGTSLVLAKALGKFEYDLVLCGMASTDGTMSVVPPMLAERLGLPQVTMASEVTVADGVVRVRRDAEDATLEIEASLPAIVSVTDQTNEPRYPSFKGIMAAKKKPVQTWSLADVGVDPADVGLDAAWTTVTDVTKRPPRSKGTIITDDGTAAAQVADYLAAEKFV